MQKRLFGILASIAVIVAACGGATTSSAPPRRRPRRPRAQSAAPVEIAAPSAADLAAEQILKIDLGSEPPTLDPNKAQDSTSIAVLHAPEPRPALLRQGPQGRPGARRGPARGLGRRQDPDLHAEGRQVQQRRPDRRRRLRLRMKRTGRPADRRAVLLRHGRGRRCRGPARPRRRGAGPVATPTSTPLLAKVGVAAPDDKTFVVNLTTPATYFLDIVALWITVPIQEKWITSPNATEAANYVGSGPFMLDTLEPQQPDHPQAEPELVRRRKPTLTEIDMSMTTEPAQGQAAFEAGELDMVLPPEPRTSSASRPTRPSGPRSSRSRRSRSPTTTSTTASIPRPSSRSRAAPTRRPARRRTRTSGSR